MTTGGTPGDSRAGKAASGAVFQAEARQKYEQNPCKHAKCVTSITKLKYSAILASLSGMDVEAGKLAGELFKRVGPLASYSLQAMRAVQRTLSRISGFEYQI